MCVLFKSSNKVYVLLRHLGPQVQDRKYKNNPIFKILILLTYANKYGLNSNPSNKQRDKHRLANEWFVNDLSKEEDQWSIREIQTVNKIVTMHYK